MAGTTIKIDGLATPIGSIGWPAMNFGQFRWNRPVGMYELSIPRSDFVRRIDPAYQNLVTELRADDTAIPDEASPLAAVGYCALESLLDQPAILNYVVRVHLYDYVFRTFVPRDSSLSPLFSLHSVDVVTTDAQEVILAGRGYWGRH